jgi:3-oxoacyl-(acyl-carrier-protein) synthase
MLRRSPVITGAGIICAAGCGVARVWDAVRAGRSGLGPLTLFPSPRFGQHLVGQVREDVEALAGPVRGSRSDKLAWIAAREAFPSAGLAAWTRLRADRFGVVVGSTTGGMLGTEAFLARWLRDRKWRPGPLRFHECASTTELLARQLDARGPMATFSTACSAGALAIAVAGELIESGEADVVLAGGCDSLCRLTLNGFGSLLLLDPHGCRPFDAGRTGISLGEGAAFLLIEAEAVARSRGAPELGRLAGWGAGCDAFHATAPHPEGDGALAAMRQALDRAGWTAADIDFVSAHGTGTPDNDAMEAKALRRLFGDRLPPVSSTKRFFGHTLAASGAVKAVLCLEALRHQAIPANLGLDIPDPAIGFEPVRDCQPRRLTRVLSNSFGFGGNNVALVLSNSEIPPARAAGVLVSERGDRAAKAAASPLTVEVSGIRRLAILDVGVISRAGMSLAEIQQSAGPGPTLASWQDAPGTLGPARVPVFACGELGAEPLIEAARRRRLNRLQQMAIVASRRCLPADRAAAVPRDRICVAFGTGLGSLNDTAAFVENLILKEERSPRPLFFTNSVHNALASQVALELGLTGLNSTTTHRDVSFETALWHGSQEVRAGRADLALVGAADELNSVALTAGVRWGWWSESAAACLPFEGQRSGRERVAAGEGCVAVALGRPGGRTTGLASVSAVRIGRPVWRGDGSLDAEVEADWIQGSLEGAGESLAEVDLLLTGANGWGHGDRQYLAVADALSRRLGRGIACGAFKQRCGEYPTASAFGFALGIGLVQGGWRPTECGVRLGAGVERRCRKVVLYTVSPSGAKGMCCLSA